MAKVLPQSQIMKGSTGWMMRDGRFIPFDADAALRIPIDNQLLILDQDIYVFNQTKIKQLFNYDAKEASIAAQKIAEIEKHYKLSYAEGATLNSLIEGKRSTIKKLQYITPGEVKQEEVIAQAEELDIDLMSDDSGAIIIMDGKDVDKFVNLLNEDYYESPVTGVKYEIKTKRELKPPSDEDLLKQVL